MRRGKSGGCGNKMFDAGVGIVCVIARGIVRSIVS